MHWTRTATRWESTWRLGLVACWLVVCVLPARAQSVGSATPVELKIDHAVSHDAFQAELDRSLDATADGWRSEALSHAATTALEQLIGGLKEVESGLAEEVGGLLDESFSCDPLRPMQLVDVFVHGPLKVRRREGSPEVASPRQLLGVEGWIEALRGLGAGLGLTSSASSDGLLIQLKPVGVELDDHEFAVTFLYQASVRQDTGSLQQSATWTTHWTYPVADGRPALRRVAVDAYEEAELRRAGSPDPGAATLFVDATAAAMSATRAYEAQVTPGLEHWIPRVSRLAGMSFLGHHGLAVGDVNGDGLEDLYVTDAAGLPNRLYLQEADGTVRDVSAESHTDWLDPSVSALLIDLDGDGDQDLVVATAFHLLLQENDGHGRFTLRDSLVEVVTAPTSLSAADYDEDGDLDLYLCGYNGDRDSRAIPGPVPYHDARNGGRNVLLENRGGFRFADVTEAVGLAENNHSYSFAAAWDDYDDDGDVDLYVANDFGRNNLYENDGGRFRDVAAEAGVEDVASGMSASWGDYDRDGRRDMYVSNMFSSAGNRVAFQRRFADAGPEQTIADSAAWPAATRCFATRATVRSATSPWTQQCRWGCGRGRHALRI
ncbi:MAG: VCBS repeat-containing protein [Thermoanaerobaculia bacterium]|nr:VCBS repeat-containing protein [Thermoanaerobaculia bacterium]